MKAVCWIGDILGHEFMDEVVAVGSDLGRSAAERFHEHPGPQITEQVADGGHPAYSDRAQAVYRSTVITP